MDIQILRAPCDRADEISKLGRRTFHNAHHTSCPKLEFNQYLDETFSFERIKEELQDSKNIFHLATVDGEPVGYSKIIHNISNPLVAMENITRMQRLYLDPAAIGKGIGLRLFETNKKLSLDKKQNGIWLTVWTKNFRAIEFYKKLGFKIAGEVLFTIGPVQNPNHLMFLDLR